MFVDMELPGWISEKEIQSICRYISQTRPKTILEAGPFGGRTTASICKSFPDIDVTAVDIFHYRDMPLTERLSRMFYLTYGKKYTNCRLTPEFFRKLHPYPNLTIIEDEYTNHKVKYDLTVFSITTEGNREFPTWEMLFDHALSHSTTVIGNFDSLGNPRQKGRKILLKKYYLDIFEDTCYILRGKK